jgi:hypothetical protein
MVHEEGHLAALLLLQVVTKVLHGLEDHVVCSQDEVLLRGQPRLLRRGPWLYFLHERGWGLGPRGGKGRGGGRVSACVCEGGGERVGCDKANDKDCTDVMLKVPMRMPCE